MHQGKRLTKRPILIINIIIIHSHKNQVFLTPKKKLAQYHLIAIINMFKITTTCKRLATKMS